MEVEQRKAVNALIRQAMPKVQALVVSQRAELGAAHVTECQRRGMAGEPGWFYAREGAMTVGTPWAAAREIEAPLDASGCYAGAALVVFRPAARTAGSTAAVKPPVHAGAIEGNPRTGPPPPTNQAGNSAPEQTPVAGPGVSLTGVVA